MSVWSEFDRVLGDAIACLRAGSDAAQELAVDLQKARAGAAEDLPAAAARALELWEGRSVPDLVAADARPALDDAGERMIAVARVILGR